MREKKTIIVALLAAAFSAAACFMPFDPPCGPTSSTPCPDGSGAFATCTSTDTKSLATTGSGGVCNTAPSGGVCNYSCSWTAADGTLVYCGGTSTPWTGLEPDGESGDCPDQCPD